MENDILFLRFFAALRMTIADTYSGATQKNCPAHFARTARFPLVAASVKNNQAIAETIPHGLCIER